MILGCQGLADYHCGLHSLEVPVSSGTRLHHSACTFSSYCGSKRAKLKAKDWCESGGSLSSEATVISSADVQASSLDNKAAEVSSDSENICPGAEGIAIYIDLPCSPSPSSDLAEVAFDRAQSEFRAVRQERIAVPGGSGGSHEQLKMTSQAEVSQRSESKIPSNLGTHVLRALLETDNVQRFKRWRATSIDPNPGSVSVSHMQENPETVSTLDMSTSRVVDGQVDNAIVRGEKVVLAEPDLEKVSDDQLRASSQGEIPPSSVEKTETKVPFSSLGTHALRALVETDDIQKLKRRRLTTPADILAVKDLKEISDKFSPDVGKISTGQSDLRESDSRGESFVLHRESDQLPVFRNSVQTESAQTVAHTDVAGSVDSSSEKTSSAGVMARGKKASGGAVGKSDLPLSDSLGKSVAHSPDIDTLDEFISGPPRNSGVTIEGPSPRKKEWLGQHHGSKVETGIIENADFVGNVGACFRSAIDERPAAPHPGFVGDGAKVQLCGICGLKEDASGSLICDSCEELFHMTCVNTRMKLVPREDEWLCRPCKKKRKMSKDLESQGDSDPGGEPKDWWRDDSGIGRLERDLLRMNNGRRTKVRLGPKYQVDVPEGTGTVDEVDLDDTLAETSGRFGREVPLTREEKRLEQERAESNLANDIWPLGWLPATKLPLGSKENWIQCTLVLYLQGELCPNGERAERDIYCGKWRRAPQHIVTNDEWECSCALVWDPRHADCAVPQELPTEEINERMRAYVKLNARQELTV